MLTFTKMCRAAERLMTEHFIFYFCSFLIDSNIFEGSQFVILENITIISLRAYDGTAPKFSSERSREF